MQYIQILRFELEHILRNRIFWLLLASFIFINAVCLYSNLQSNDGSSTDLTLEDYQIEYNEFLSEITVKSDENKTIQLFHNDPYTVRNIDKTKQDYQSLQNIPITWYGGKALTLVLCFPVTDILMLLFLSYCILLSVLDTKRNGMISFLRTMPNGRERLAFAKINALFIICLFVIFVFYGTNIIFANPMSISFESPLQCLWGYMRSTWKISIGMYLLIYLLCKWLALFLLTLILFLVGCLASHVIYYYSAILGISILNGICYTLGSHVGKIEFLKYFNLFFFYSTGKATSLYHNYNLLGYPISIHTVNTICILIFVIVFTILGCKCFAIIHKQYSTFTNLQKKTFITINENHRVKHHLIFHTECYKLLYGNRIIIFFILICLFQLYQYNNKSAHWYQDDLYYRNYITMVEGNYTEEKLELLQTEQKQINAAKREFDKLDSQFSSNQISESYYTRMTEPYLQEMKKENALNRAISYVSYIKSLGNHAGILYTRGWEYLSKNTISTKNAVTLILYLICIILSLSGIYAQEYQHGTVELLNTYPYQNRSNRYKKILILGICTGFFILIYVPEFIWTVKEYSLDGLFYSLDSIPCFSPKFHAIPIFLFYLILYLIRIIFGILIGWVVSITGKYIKNTNRTTFLYLMILGIITILWFVI